MIKNRSAPSGTIVPWLAYSDVSQAMSWLSAAFGFIPHLHTPLEADGSIHHAQLSVGAGSVVLTTGPLQSGISLFVAVDNVDAHYDRACEFGARIVSPPTTHIYGERQYTAEDLAGYRWTFSQSVADVDPAEWGAIVTRL
ncbi:MAG: VOC family protein [Ignavibacteriota bacterium]